MVITSQFLLYWFVLKQSHPRIPKLANLGQTYNGILHNREYSYVNNNSENFRCVLLSLLFYLEDGSSNFPRNICELLHI